MSSRAEQDGRYQRWDASIGTAAVVLAVAAPLCLGAVHPATQLVFSTAVLLLTLAYASTRARRGIRIVPFVGLFAAFVALDLFQLLPLPAPLAQLLSPTGFDIRAAVDGRRWTPLTLDVPATTMALVRAFACLGLLVTVAGVCRTRRNAKRILMVLALFGAVEAIVAIVQRAVGAKAILGLYVPRSASGMGVFGTLVNSNHTASVLTIGALVAAGLALEGRDTRRRLLYGGAAILAAGVVVATGSRGGLLGLAAGGFLLLAVVLVASKGILQGLITAVAMLAAFAAIVLWSGDQIRARLAAPSATLVDNQKTRGWSDGMRMASDYRWTGVGRGAFEAPLRAYRSDDEEVRLVYPENFLVQSASEWGIVATIALLLGAAFAARKVLRQHDVLELPWLGAGAAVIAVTLHELMDFGTEFPGVVFPATVALGVVVGISMRSDESARRVTPALWTPIAATWIAVLVLGGWASAHTLDADDLKLREATIAHQSSTTELVAAIARHPADDYLEMLATEQAMRRRDASAMRHINRALLLHPSSWRAHELAARLLIGVGHRSQAAIELGLAAQHGLLLDDRELVRLLGSDVIKTVPQEPAPLMGIAARMIAIGRTQDAETAWARALELSDAREPLLVARAQAAMLSHDPALIERAATALLAEAKNESAFVVAADAFVAANAPAKASQAVERGLRAWPGAPSLALAGARIELAGGHLDTARQRIAAADQRSFTLEQRRDAQLLLGAIAERAGDAESVAIAHARAQLLERQIREIRAGNPQGAR